MFFIERMNKGMKNVEGVGLLEYDGDAYIGKLGINIFAHDYEVDIRFRLYDAGPDGLTSELIIAFQNCLNVLKNQTIKILYAIMEYYNEDVKENAEDGFCDYIEMRDYNQLSDVMTPKEIYIVNLSDTEIVRNVRVGIYFECDWNDEGFAIRFDGDGNIVKVGTGDILY